MPIVVAERCGLPHSFMSRAVKLQLRGKLWPCFIYLFVFVVSRTFPPNIATCDRFFSLTHQEAECLCNTSRYTFFLVVSIKTSGCTENKHTTSLLWDCVSVLSSAVFACGNGLVFFKLETDTFASKFKHHKRALLEDLQTNRMKRAHCNSTPLL